VVSLAIFLRVVDKMDKENTNAEKIITNFCSTLSSALDFSQRKSKLIQLLEEIQKSEGHISRQVAVLVSDSLQIPLSHVYGVITFYNSLKLEQNAKFVINVCTGTACHVNGSAELLKILKKEIKACASPEIFSVDTVNCVGACSLAPVVMINGKVHGHMNGKKIKSLVLDFVNENNNDNRINKKNNNT